MDTIPTTAFASASMYGITRLSYYPTQATEHTCCNLLVWGCFHHYKKHIEM